MTNTYKSLVSEQKDSTADVEPSNDDIHFGVEDDVEYDENEVENLDDTFGSTVLLQQGIQKVNADTFLEAFRFVSTSIVKAAQERKALLDEYRRNSGGDSLELTGESPETASESINRNKHLIQLQNMYKDLRDSERREAFHLVAAHLLGDECVKTESNPDGQLLTFFSGEGGTGKSNLIQTIVHFARTVYGYDNSINGPVAITAPTGIAAHNIGGKTCQATIPVHRLKSSEGKIYLFILLIYRFI